MNFRTEINPPKILDLELKSKFYSTGSCFANMIGRKLTDHKFNCTSNPFGIIYNPISIFKVLSNNIDIENSMIKNDGIWYNYNLHSEFRNENKDELVKTIEQVKSTSTHALHNAEIIIITLGTAFTYNLKTTNEIVANCHKTPQKEFTKELLSVEQIISEFEKCELNNLKSKIIFTVSPVRHIKDTIELNSVSKSVLRMACHQLQEKYSNVYYFPSYELMMDDLRDYRFYKDDLLHPTEFAENYIWEKFKLSIFNSETLNFIDNWTKIKSALDHIPFNPKSEKHQSFLKSQFKKLETLNKTIDCKTEIHNIKEQLTGYF